MATSAQVFSHRMFLNILVLFFLFLTRAYMMTTVYHRRSQGLSKGESHCVKVRVLTRLSCRPPRRVFHLKQRLKRGLFNHGQDIGVAFSPPFVGCLVKKARQKGGSRAPQDPPGYALGLFSIFEKARNLTFFRWHRDFFSDYAKFRTHWLKANVKKASTSVFSFLAWKLDRISSFFNTQWARPSLLLTQYSTKTYVQGEQWGKKRY